MSRESVHLPPRSSLPRDVVLPVLPGLGLAWYDHRGRGYWTRRVGLALMWVIVTALVTLLVVGVLAAIRRSSPAGFYVVLGVQVAYSAAILAFVAVRTARQWNDPGAGRRPRSRGASTRAAGKGGGSRLAHALGQVFLAFSFLTVGLYLAMLLTSLLPETPAERRARLQVAEELRGRGHVAQGP